MFILQKILISRITLCGNNSWAFQQVYIRMLIVIASFKVINTNVSFGSRIISDRIILSQEERPVA